MTPEQLKELKQAAMKLNEGGWTSSEQAVWGGDGDGVCACYHNIGHMPLAIDASDRADFIAAANPTAILSLIDQVEALTVPEKMAPVQGYKAGIPWSLHLEAYDAYSKRYTPQQALIEGGCRGGFGTGELDMFIPGWRERVSEIGRLKARIAELERAAPTIPAIPGTKEGA